MMDGYIISTVSVLALSFFVPLLYGFDGDIELTFLLIVLPGSKKNGFKFPKILIAQCFLYTYAIIYALPDQQLVFLVRQL